MSTIRAKKYGQKTAKNRGCTWQHKQCTTNLKDQGSVSELYYIYRKT